MQRGNVSGGPGRSGGNIGQKISWEKTGDSEEINASFVSGRLKPGRSPGGFYQVSQNPNPSYFGNSSHTFGYKRCCPVSGGEF